jgi:1,2-phenylacetyl-CoA epoxidase PaaB subunit
MPRFHFHVKETENFIEDEDGQEFTETESVRREAVETGASIARDAFVRGSAQRVIVDVRRGDMPFLKVSISLDVEDEFD